MHLTFGHASHDIGSACMLREWYICDGDYRLYDSDTKWAALVLRTPHDPMFIYINIAINARAFCRCYARSSSDKLSVYAFYPCVAYITSTNVIFMNHDELLLILLYSMTLHVYVNVPAVDKSLHCRARVSCSVYVHATIIGDEDGINYTTMQKIGLAVNRHCRKMHS